MEYGILGFLYQLEADLDLIIWLISFFYHLGFMIAAN